MSPETPAEKKLFITEHINTRLRDDYRIKGRLAKYLHNIATQYEISFPATTQTLRADHQPHRWRRFSSVQVLTAMNMLMLGSDRRKTIASNGARTFKRNTASGFQLSTILRTLSIRSNGASLFYQSERTTSTRQVI